MGQVLGTFLGKSFRPAKCKLLLNQAILHSKQLRSQKVIQCNAITKDISKLLQNGQEAMASSKVEDFFKEQNMIDAYVLIEGFCNEVINKMILIGNEKYCPSHLREAISSICFAAQRCADFPELQQIRSLFTAKYGRQFTTALPEVQPECAVNKEIAKKLSISIPSGETKLKLMKEIANENGIEWKFENLLDGSELLKEGRKLDLSSRCPARASSDLENTKDVSDLDKRPVDSQTAVILPEPDIYRSVVLSPFSSSENRKKTIARSNRSGELDSSEQEQSSSLWTEGKTIQNKGRKSRNFDDCYQESHGSNSNDCCARFSRAKSLYKGYKEEKITCTDVATAAQVALKSAARAATAAHAALSLAKSQYTQKSSQTSDDSSEITSDSSDQDEAFEKAFLIDRNEQRNSKYSQRFGRDISNRISASSPILKCSKKQRDIYDDSDDEYHSYGIPSKTDSQLKQGKTEACFGKPMSLVKPNSNDQLSLSKFYDDVEEFSVMSSMYPRILPRTQVNHSQNCLCDDDFEKYVSLFYERQNQDPGQVKSRSVSEVRPRPRMNLEGENKTQKLYRSRTSDSMESDDFEMTKFKFRSRTPMPRKSTMMDCQGSNDLYEGISNKFIVCQNSLKERSSRYEATDKLRWHSGKLRWHSANLQDRQEQCVSFDEKEKNNSYCLPKTDFGNNDVKLDKGFNYENISELSGKYSTDLVVVDESVHGHQEKNSLIKDVLSPSKTAHAGTNSVETKETECPRIDLARLPKSFRSARSFSFNAAD